MVTLGFILALICSFSQSVKDISMKNNLKDIDSNSLVFLLSFLSVILWLPFVIYQGIPELRTKFWIVFILSGTLFYVGKLFSFKAMSIEDISYIAPLRGLIGVFVVVLGMLFLNEIPSLLSAFGILIVIVGAYYLNLQKYHTKLLDPIKHLFSNKGSQFFLVTIFCYGFTTVFDKIGVLESSPIFWIFMMNLSLLGFSFNKFRKTIGKNKDKFISKYKYVLLTFCLYATVHITQMYALKYIFVSYVVSIKIASMIFTVFLGGLFFKEKGIKRKLIISAIIVLGVLFIYFGR